MEYEATPSFRGAKAAGPAASALETRLRVVHAAAAAAVPKNARRERLMVIGFSFKTGSTQLSR